MLSYALPHLAVQARLELARVHLALGETDEALAAFHKAVDATGHSKRDEERKAAIREKIEELETPRD